MNKRDEIQQEAVKSALLKNYGTLDISVRTGKTKIGLEIASKFKNVLVSYPNLPIKNSWIKDSEEFSIPIEHIVFTTHISISKQDLNLYDCVILDEIDQVSEKSIEYITSNLPIRMYGLTGTLPTFGIKLDFLTNYCPVIYTKKIEEITGTLVKDYEIQVHLLKPSEKQDIKLSSGKFWSEKAQIQFFENKYQITKNFKMMLLLIKAVQNSKTKFDYLQTLVKTTDKCLIFLETKEQCKQLKLPSYYSGLSTSEQNLEDFQNGKINYLSSIGQLKAGVTFKNVDKAILLHCYSSSSKAHQRCARVLNYVENVKATLYIIGLKNTRDEDWIKKGLQGFDQNKIKYIDVNSNISTNETLDLDMFKKYGVESIKMGFREYKVK